MEKGMPAPPDTVVQLNLVLMPCLVLLLPSFRVRPRAPRLVRAAIRGMGERAKGGRKEKRTIRAAAIATTVVAAIMLSMASGRSDKQDGL